MAKQTWSGGSIGNERIPGAGQPETAEPARKPEKRDPDMDRYAIGSNDPDYRTSK